VKLLCAQRRNDYEIQTLKKEYAGSPRTSELQRRYILHQKKMDKIAEARKKERPTEKNQKTKKTEKI
jgi:hypothetical protein